MHITRFCYKTKLRAIKMSDSDFVQYSKRIISIKTKRCLFSSYITILFIITKFTNSALW